MGISRWFVRGQECFIEDWMDLFPHGQEPEMVRCESFLPEDFEGAISFLSQLLAGLCHGDVGSFQPNLVSFFVIVSIHSLLVVECLHCLSCLGQCSLCVGSGFSEVVNEVLGRLAFDFVTGFKSFIGVSSVVEEEWRVSCRCLFFVVV